MLQRRHLLTTALAGSLGPAWAADAPDEQITWYDYDLPPISIVSGPQANEGINNLVRKRLMAALPGYQHHVRVANFTRITETLRNGELSACVGLQKTPERELAMQFSLPFTIANSPCAIVLGTQVQALRAKLDAEGKLPLEQALASGGLKVGIAGGRSYGPVVNQILEKQAGSNSVITRNSNDVSAGLLDMLQARRFDFTIMFPEEAQFLARQLGDKVQLLSFPIKETPAYASVHVAAPKNAWGSRLLAQINPLLQKFRDTPEFHRERQVWMDDEARKRYKPLIAAMLKD